MGYPGDEDDVQANAGDAFEADHQLTLTGEDDTLPWLASDDEEEDEGGGTDYRILIFAVIALLALGGILWAAKSFFDNRSEPGLVADGSTIEAPAGDYKERPANPGGQDVAGTGDLSYEVGEGVTREAQLDGGEGTPTPSVDLGQSSQPRPASPSGSPSPAATTAAATSGVGVQVGAYQSRASAETGWSQLSSRYPVLQGASHRVVEGTVDSGTIYRLQAVAANGAAADAMCRAIRNAGGDCQVKR
ncbi:MAG: SPOR domain-containing protein [Alteraurantiacibacter sp.]